MSRLGARADWEARIGRRSDAGEAGSRLLPPPDEVTASSGAGQVTLRWSRVEGAIGYRAFRAPSADGPWVVVDHGGMDVLTTPGPVYSDTTGEPGVEQWYAIASVAGEEDGPGELSSPVRARPVREPAAPLRATADASGDAGRLERVWSIIGSERLSQLREGDGIGEEFAEALALARDELGARRVRAHAIFHDDLGVVREDGSLDFSVVDEVYDQVLEIGLRPVVELSFMPRAMAADPDASVFEYVAGISVPRDWDAWASLCGALAAHLVDRYGIDEVATWGFEVWNEANLEVFWTGSQADYFRLYELAARAIKDVDSRLLVGGPSTAASGWIPDFLDFVLEAGAPLDFLSTHLYGNLPLDIAEALRVRGMEGIEVLWTEWGVIPTHFAPVNDSVLSATFLLQGMKSAQGRLDGLAYWVVSDHFEELGRPPALLHGGFGLLAVHGLRKPRWWALALAQALGDDLLPLSLEGDGAGGLVDGWAARGDDGNVDVLLWNGTLDHSKAGGAPLLDRDVELTIEGLEPGTYSASLARVDELHSNLAARWDGSSAWPDDAELAALRDGDVLHEEPLGVSEDARFQIPLPMPGIARLRLRRA